MKLLRIDSSIQGESSASRILTTAIVEQLRSAVPDLEVLARDLAGSPLPHLTLAHLPQAHPLSIKERTHEVDDEERIASQEALEEFLQSDVIVIGAPMYNFTIPSQLKAWIDRVAVAGKTFRYTENGPQGLAGGKKVIIASGRGGIHTNSPTDFQEAYLRQVFAFLGVTDVEFVRAEGVAYSPQHRSDAIAGALTSIPQPVRLAA